MKDSVFREYDIRGIVNGELTLTDIYDLGCAIAYYFKEHNPDFKIVVLGIDGRTHSPAIKESLTKAFLDSGIDVVFLGMCPTPALYFSLYTMEVDGGIMITASHNGPEYNGMKICLGHTSIWGKNLQDIKKLYHEKKAIKANRKATHAEYEIVPDYVRWLADHFQDIQNIDMNVAIDCGNGAAGTAMPALIKAMGWQNVELLFEKVDGTFPNHEADPTVAENMVYLKKEVIESNFHLGIGLDGDCDRMVPMTKKGTLIPGDQLLAVFAERLVADHPGAGVVFDIKSSEGLIELLERWGAKPIMAPSGHSIIKDMMTQHGALLGGELSCHFFFKDRYFGYDDGIYAALRLIEILYTSGKTLSELVSIFPKKFSSKEFRLFCPDDKKQMVVEEIKKELEKMPDVSLITLDGIRATFPFGWGIIRPSNTQAALSMRFESDTQEGLEKLLTLYKKLLSAYLDQKELEKVTKEHG